ncbi:MAG TPA: sugar ABC transporter substrate-binding protein, partial [Planctomycetota bacterium]|nr:sugar ABC transporter substrate-binding protein [Planctomycetota bacterium]
MKTRLFILCVLLVGALAGCTTRGADEGKTVLTYTRWGDPSELDSTRELIAQFMAENPDIVVRVDVVSWGQYWQKMATAVATSTAQDVWLMSAAYVEQYAAAGHLLDLKPFMDNDPTFNLDDYFPHPFDDYCFVERKLGLDAKGRDVVELRNASFGDENAKCYAFTRDYNCQLLFYNRDHFDAENVTYPNENWTWDDMVSAAKKLTVDKDGDGMIDRWGIYGLNYNALARTIGGSFLDVPRRKSTYNSPEVLEALDFCRALIYDYEVCPPPALQIEGEAFTTGKASMTIEGVWSVRRFDSSKYLWDVTLIPVKKGYPRTSIGGGVAHCIYAKTRHPHAAWKLVKFLSDETSQRELARSGTSVPVLKSAALSDDFLAPFQCPSKKSHRIIFDYLMRQKHEPSYTRGYLTYSQFAADTIRGVWLNIRTPEEACRMIDEF